ncbi:MAG: hypothetical protein ACJAV6_000383 [Candidatus Paceibacteria bacterium]|jgi:hypothetical protein
MNRQQTYLTIAFCVFLVVLNIWMLGFGKILWLMSNVNLLFHEAGHFAFGFFGRFIMVLGGTLGELIIPSLFIGHFALQRNVPGQVFGWWWVSTALYNISIYIADARGRILPLLGGQDGHDWAYLLGRTSLLNQDILISKLVIIVVFGITAYMIHLIYNYWHLQQGKILS